jgi:hypothetical protein
MKKRRRKKKQQKKGFGLEKKDLVDTQSTGH